MIYSGLPTRCIQLGLNRAHTSPTRKRGESRRRSPRWRVLVLRCFELNHLEGLSRAGGPTSMRLFQAVEMSSTHDYARIEQTTLGATGRTRPVF